MNLGLSIISVVIMMGCVHTNKPAGQVIPKIWKTCPNKDIAHRLLITTLQKCVYECAMRDHCKHASYCYKTMLCALHGYDDMPSMDRQAGRCVVVFRKDIHMDIDESDKVCDVDNDGKGNDNKCNVKECQPFTLESGKIVGNLNSIGSRKKVICDCGYFELERKMYVVCQENGTWDYVPTCKADWELLLRGTPGIGKSLYDTWMNQILTTNEDTECRSTCETTCSAHYKNPKVDQWRNQCWKKIKISFWKGCKEVAFVVFDASGSTDKTKWFSKERILNSSWTDIATEKHNYFSIEGAVGRRRFYTNRNYGGCNNDAGWTLVDDSGAYYCIYEQPTFPRFLYSSRNIHSKATEYDVADVFAIHGHL